MTRTTYSLSRRVVLVSGIAAATVGAEAIPAAAGSGDRSDELALTHVTVINPVDGVPRPDSTILIRGDRIVRTGPSGLVHISGRIATGYVAGLPVPQVSVKTGSPAPAEG